MSTQTSSRSSKAWIAALLDPSGQSTAVIGELTTLLRRRIARGMGGQLDETELSDVVHESLRSIIDALPSFRGDSMFTTWATGVALRVAYTELRRRHVRQRALGAFEAAQAEAQRLVGAEAPAPDEVLSRTHLLHALEQAIASRLTERQRVAIVAELRGVPTVEIARQMGTTVNALYKLTHDARRRLRAALHEAGFGSLSGRPAQEAPSCR